MKMPLFGRTLAAIAMMQIDITLASTDAMSVCRINPNTFEAILAKTDGDSLGVILAP
jgi:hypothetical protein